MHPRARALLTFCPFEMGSVVMVLLKGIGEERERYSEGCAWGGMGGGKQRKKNRGRERERKGKKKKKDS